ncbi:hypothetical protein [Croceimicrobium sp.]|uniref:hypothetical protein n=1 Tax=Croceimicrobium sp. TaxID=2828340 RepID=UPI003BAADA1D
MKRINLIVIGLIFFFCTASSAQIQEDLLSSKYSFEIQEYSDDTLDIRVILRLDLDTIGGDLKVQNIEVLAYKIYKGLNVFCFDNLVSKEIQCDSLMQSYVDHICDTIRDNPKLIEEGEFGDVNLRVDKFFRVRVEPL